MGDPFLLPPRRPLRLSRISQRPLSQGDGTNSIQFNTSRKSGVLSLRRSIDLPPVDQPSIHPGSLMRGPTNLAQNHRGSVLHAHVPLRCDRENGLGLWNPESAIFVSTY